MAAGLDGETSRGEEVLMGTSDTALVKAWRSRRDPEAFRAIVARHSGMVYGVCRRMLGDPAAAEDVTQECFVKLLGDSLRTTESLPAWLHTVATRRCLDVLRSEKRRRAREERYAAKAGEGLELSWSMLEPVLDEALAELPEHLRAPIVCHFLEGLSHEAAAARLGVSRRTVGYRIGKGLERLGETLRGRGVSLGMAALPALLQSNAAETAPASLAGHLSKISLAAAARPAAVRVPSSFLAKCAGFATGAAVGVLLVLGAWSYFERASARANGGVPRAGVEKGVVATSDRARAKDESPLAEDDALLRSATSGGDGMGANAVAALPVSTEAEEAVPGSISGYVMDEQGAPIAGATVMAAPDTAGFMDGYRSGANCTAISDESGFYTLSPVRFAGNIAVNATAQDFGPGVQAISFLEGQNLTDVDFILKAGVTLLARVLAVDGTPVEGALVNHFGFHGVGGGGGNFGYDRMAVTDADGRFLMPFPEEGTADLKVTTPQQRQAAFTVPVERGREAEMRLSEPARISGRVAHADGTPGAGLKVIFKGHVRETCVPTSYDAVTDENGYYEVKDVAPNLEYRAQVSGAMTSASSTGTVPGGDVHPVSREQVLGVLSPGEQRTWDCTLEPPIRIAGHVWSDPGHEPLEACVNAVGVDGKAQQVNSENDGSYVLQLFEAGTYRLSAQLQGAEDDSERPSQDVNVSPGDEKTIDFVLPEPFSLAVRVVDGSGRPLKGVEVQVVRTRPQDPGSASIFSSGKTDERGSYVKTGLEPGLEMWCSVKRPRSSVNEGSNDKVVETTHIVGEAGVDYPEELVVLYETAGLEGAVVDEAGRPVANAELDLAFICSGVDLGGAVAGVRDLHLRVQTDRSGRFSRVDGVPATTGAVTLSLGAGLKSETATVECSVGKVTDLGRVVLRQVVEAEKE